MKRVELISVVIVMAVGAFLRLYHLPETLMFRGDQGRDAIIAKNILKERDIALIGPVTSVGNMYLGPLYYYFMVPFLALTYPDPVGPAYGVALINILTIFLIYWVGKKTINVRTGLVGAAIFALMPIAIIYGRFSWNPNIAPFFSILVFYYLYRWWTKRSVLTFFITALLIGLLAQTHYVSLTMAAAMALLWGYRLLAERKVKSSLYELGAGMVGFGLPLSPLVIFDLRHDHLISKQFISFLTSPEEHMRSQNFFDQVYQVAIKTKYVLASLIHIPGNFDGDTWLAIAAAGLLLIYAIRFKRQTNQAFKLLVVCLAMAIVGTSFYSHSTYPHYLTYCFPLVALFWAFLLTSAGSRKQQVGQIIIGGFILTVVLLGLPKVGWTGNGSKILKQTVTWSLPYITPPYNVALLSDDKDYKGMSYRYFFETSGVKPKNLDDYAQLNTLVLIDETFLENPRSVPIYEIQAAKDFEMEKQIMVPDGPSVYILKKR